MGFSVVQIDEIDGSGLGNAVKFVRRRLGVVGGPDGCTMRGNF